jgi:hypothetical protein
VALWGAGQGAIPKYGRDLLLFRTRWISITPSSRALLVCLGVEMLDLGARIQTVDLLCLPVVFHLLQSPKGGVMLCRLGLLRLGVIGFRLPISNSVLIV